MHLQNLQRDRTVGLLIRLSDTLAHEIKEGKLRRAGAEFVHESRRKVRAEDGAEVVVRDLLLH